MQDRFEVTVGAGSMMSASGSAVRFPHRWTPGGVTVEAGFTGGHLLHLAVAGCVLNDVYREAAALGIELAGVRVTAAGGVRYRDMAIRRYRLYRRGQLRCPGRPARSPA
jgi:uncharacterized OsmC-like protein